MLTKILLITVAVIATASLGQADDGKHMSWDELVESRSDPTSLAKYVLEKAGKGALQAGNWFKNELDAGKYEQAYEEHVIRPCEKYRKQLSNVLKDRQNFDDMNMMKTMLFCSKSGDKSSAAESFAALKSMKI